MIDPAKLPLLIPCACGRVVMVTGDGADLVRLVEEKNELVRVVERLREELWSLNILASEA